ncbi:MAG: exodeoxyribonuclease VII large subunit, partial [Oscillospiraceae bacterium]
VTSKTGAALQDIINVISRRFPLTKLIVYGANVQGENAYKEIVKGIKYIDDNNLADVIIVARGGGSAEDLWVFNHEEIAFAAYTCKTPLISAIGHEIDFTILDFVADMRAPTPSAAAELAVPDMQNMYKKCNDLCININKSVFNKFNLCYNEYCDLLQNKSLSDVRNFSDTSREKLVLLQEKIKISAENKLKEKILKFNNFAGLSATLNPANVFKRGYCHAMFNKKTLTKNNLPCKGEQLYIIGDSYNITCEAIKIDTEN